MQMKTPGECRRQPQTQRSRPRPTRCPIGARSMRLYETSEEIADIALFLASDAAVNLVGAVLLANGGRFTA